jgi:RNA polymerase sigma-70 factor (ECF subfamily)
MPDPVDEEMIAKAGAGDMHAFRYLVEKHQGFVYALSYRFVRTTADAEDITQEAFIRLWKNLPRYRREIKLTTWLYKIAVNLCLDFLKSSYRKGLKRTLDLEASAGSLSDAPADQAILENELRSAMEIIAAQLSPKQKAVFILRDLEDRTMEEIGEILEMSQGQVKSNLYYARKKVGEEIAVHYQTKKVKP